MTETIVKPSVQDYEHLLIYHRFYPGEDFKAAIRDMSTNIYNNPDKRGPRTWSEVVDDCITGVALEWAACDAFGFQLLKFGGLDMADVVDPKTGAKFDLKSDHENKYWAYQSEHMTQLVKAIEEKRTDFILTGTADTSHVHKDGYIDVRFKMVVDARTFKKYSKWSYRKEETGLNWLYYDHRENNDCVCRR